VSPGRPLSDTIADMQAAGEEVPQPLSDHAMLTELNVEYLDW
jgi:hypothetical protein